MWLRRGICFLMALVLLAGAVCAAGYDPKKVHQPLDFDEMAFEPFDETALSAALDDLEALCGPDCQEDSLPEARRLYETILSEYEHLDTLYALAHIHYCISGTDRKWAKAESTLLEQDNRLRDRILAAFRELAGSPCREVLDESKGSDYTEALRHYEDMSDTMSRLLREENDLVQDYEQALTSGAEVTVDGQVWTDETLAESDLDAEDYQRISDLLDKALNDATGEIFRQLIQVRTAIAEEEGYRSYMRYAYANYIRDYSPWNVRRIRNAVKSHFVPLDAIRYDSYDTDALNDAFQTLHLEGKTLMQAIQPGLSAIHPDLETSFDFMMQHNLYDTDLRPGKLSGGFTINLADYGSAYIYNNPYGSYRDCSDMVHEFGHFNQYFYDTTPSFWARSNIDVAEIHSQALQLLYASSADLFGEASDDFFFSILSELVSSIQEGCMYDEFLEKVYDDPDLSLDEINRIFKDVSEEYGYYYPDGQEESWFWVRIPHNFQTPFYYISYAVSALSSLDLWLRSLDDWDGAVQTYIDLTALETDISLQAALEEVGLADIFDAVIVREIANATENVFLGQEVHYRPSGGAVHFVVTRAAHLLGMTLGLSLCLLPFVLIIFVLYAFSYRRKVKKQLQVTFSQKRKS